MQHVKIKQILHSHFFAFCTALTLYLLLGFCNFYISQFSVMLMKNIFKRLCRLKQFSALYNNSVLVNCEMCECGCVCVFSCHIRIRMCVMSDVVGVTDYAVTAAVNPSNRLGGMNTCDRHRARERVQRPHRDTHTRPRD